MATPTETCSHQMTKDMLAFPETLASHYRETWSAQDLEEWQNTSRAAVSLASIPSDDACSCSSAAVGEVSAQSHLMLSEVLKACFTRDGELFDAEERVQVCEELVRTQTKPTLELKAQSLLYLGSALRSRASISRANEEVDLERAEAIHREAVQLLPPGLTLRAVALSELGATLVDSHAPAEGEQRLDEAVEFHREALSLGLSDGLSKPTLLYRLSVALFWSNMGQRHLAEAKELAKDALNITPAGHPDRPAMVRHLGEVLTRAYRFSSNPGMPVLDEARQVLQEGLDECHVGHLERPKILATLSRVHWWMVGKRNLVHEIETSVKLGQQALELCPPGHTYRRDCLASLTIAINTRGGMHDSLDDFETANALGREQVTLCKQGTFSRRVATHNLAFSVLRYSRRSGHRNLAYEAVDLFRQVLSSLPPDASDFKSVVVSTLGAALQVLFDMTEDIRHLQEAVSVHEDAVAAIDKDSAYYHPFMDRLATATSLLYEVSHDPVVLGRAFEIRTEFITSISSEDDDERYRVEASMAMVHIDRFEATGNKEDIERAIQLLNHALTLTPLGHHERSVVLFALTRLHLAKGSRFCSMNHAIKHLNEALADDCCNLQERLVVALKLLRTIESLAANQDIGIELREQLFSTCKLAISLLPRAAYFGVNAQARLEILSRAKDLSICTAVHGIKLGRPEAAVEILEEGRAVFWASYMRLRSSFDELPGNLAQKLQAASKKIGEYDAKGPSDDNSAMRRRLHEEWEDLLCKARINPGFERFLLPSTFDRLSQAAAKAPIVVLLASESVCSAIIIQGPSSGLRVTALPKCSLKRLEELIHSLECSNGQARSSTDRAIVRRETKAQLEQPLDLYAELWDNVMMPVTTTLGLKKAAGRHRSRIVICSTGSFTRLPVHVAGVYRGTADEYLSAYCVASYTPTIGTLLNLQPFDAPRRSEAKALLAAVPYPFKWRPLPHAFDEVAAIRAAIPPESLLSLPQTTLDPTRARGGTTAADVLQSLPAASLLHIACHGYQDRDDALQSGFVMHDRVLTLAELLGVRHPRAPFLAFLSACETARGDARQPDQVVHLAAALLVAGFRSVVGTMWSMGDTDGPAVALRVYRELFGGEGERLDPEVVPYALDAAVQDLRMKGLHPSRWATYVHLGV